MGWISVVFAHKVIGVATGDAPDGETLRARLLRSVGLDPAAPVDPEQLIGDTSLSRFFDTHLDGALAELPEDGGLGRRVRAEIAQALSEGVPTLPRMGARLGMSGRTLQRRLGEAGLSYRDLVDEARKELADRLLRQTDYGLAEIAFLTGFSEQSAFHRAFNRWTRQTPRSYREKARSGPV